MDLSRSSLKILLFLITACPQTSAVRHSLQYLYTAVTPGINFPEFTAVGLVDGGQIVYYDSNIRKMIPRVEWIPKISDYDYWNIETESTLSDQKDLHHLLHTVMKSFNHTKGLHTLQRMFGCELNFDWTVRGYNQFGYDGEDFISLDLKTGTWTAAKPQAKIIKKKWDNDPGYTVHWKNYLENICIEWLKMYMFYSRERNDPPTASVIQKHSPSPEVVCHATGFFPKAVNIFWRKDGRLVYKNVEFRDTLPNQDGSFQKRSILKVPAEDLQKHTYTCVIQHSSLKEELVLEVPKGGGLMPIIVGVLVALVDLVAVVAGIMVWKKKNSGFKPAPPSEGESSSDKSD
ncbi:BOLA class I histocompatibility antigen, alpha chain BL3-7-like [Hemibagrus wyckioides]|uniref:BOLA class I histocompatibility antigen, alpha chain BL3-7-like n=1 Tax=Hemibagrus wyckioides TaxID=337641 RepID=UPI00266D728D|nr:BOLA class I histocompatibility antigen, alpha chain BL3-7-like [Hemibagrus wyckioides]XP_058231054.1 BOLA class I histocompatibility antigen, alpha chain BL3-7-like [Hemibagrus wyckioides]